MSAYPGNPYAEIASLRARCEAAEAEVGLERIKVKALADRALAAERSRDEARAETQRMVEAIDRVRVERDEAREAQREAPISGQFSAPPMPAEGTCPECGGDGPAEGHPYLCNCPKPGRKGDK